MFVHFQYGRATFALKNEAFAKEFCNVLASYIKLYNKDAHQYEANECKMMMKELLDFTDDGTVKEFYIGDENYFDIVLERVVDFPSQEVLITRMIEIKDATLLYVSSVESLRTSSPAYKVCVVNNDNRPVF